MYPNHNWINAPGQGSLQGQIPFQQAHQGHEPHGVSPGEMPQQAPFSHQQQQGTPTNPYPGYSNSQQHMAPHSHRANQGYNVNTQTPGPSQLPSYGTSYGMLNQSAVPQYPTSAQGPFFPPMTSQNHYALNQAPAPNTYSAFQQPIIAGDFPQIPVMPGPLQSPFATPQQHCGRASSHITSSNKAGGQSDDARGAFQMPRERGNTPVQTWTGTPPPPVTVQRSGPFGPQGRLALIPPPPARVTHEASNTSTPTVGAVIAVHSRRAAGCGGTYAYYADKQGREEYLWMSHPLSCKTTLVTEVKVWLGKQNWSAVRGYSGIEIGGPFYMKVELEGRKQRFVLIRE